MSGSLMYLISEGTNRLKLLNLTVCCDDDSDLSRGSGLAELRRRRLLRLIEEAKIQGAALTYKDLKLILLSSHATLKRDVSYLRKMGVAIPMGKLSRRQDMERVQSI